MNLNQELELKEKVALGRKLFKIRYKDDEETIKTKTRSLDFRATYGEVPDEVEDHHKKELSYKDRVNSQDNAQHQRRKNMLLKFANSRRAENRGHELAGTKNDQRGFDDPMFAFQRQYIDDNYEEGSPEKAEIIALARELGKYGQVITFVEDAYYAKQNAQNPLNKPSLSNT